MNFQYKKNKANFKKMFKNTFTTKQNPYYPITTWHVLHIFSTLAYTNQFAPPFSSKWCGSAYNCSKFKLLSRVKLLAGGEGGKGFDREFTKNAVVSLFIFFFRLEMLWVGLQRPAPSTRARLTHFREKFYAGTLILSRSLSSLRVKLCCLYLLWTVYWF